MNEIKKKLAAPVLETADSSCGMFKDYVASKHLQAALQDKQFLRTIHVTFQKYRGNKV